jgi:hypothetical protein
VFVGLNQALCQSRLKKVKKRFKAFTTFALMKKLYKIIFAIVILGFVFLNTGCNNSSMFAKVTLQGYVYDSLGGKPVEGVWVYLYACEYDGKDDAACQPIRVGQAQTDVSGRFYLHDDAARSHRYGLMINDRLISGSLSFGTDANWLKANCSMIYLNKL